MENKKGGLVLTRNVGKSVIITDSETGDRISVKVVSVHGQQAGLCFAAEAKYIIHREEIQARVDKELDGNL